MSFRRFSCNGFSKIIQSNDPEYNTKKCSPKKYYSIPPVKPTLRPPIIKQNIYMLFYGTDCSFNRDLSEDPPNFISFSNNDPKVFLVKYSPEGKFIWYTYIVNFDITTFTGISDSLVIDNNLENIYFMCKTIPISGVTTIYNATTDLDVPPIQKCQLVNNEVTQYYTYLLKYNSSGQCEWLTYFGNNNNTGFDLDSKILLDTIGNIYITGVIINEFTNNSFNIYDASMLIVDDIVTPQPKYTSSTTQFSNSPGYLLKYDSNGKNQWVTYFGSMELAIGIGIALDNQNNIYLTGFTYNGEEYFDMYDMSMSSIGIDGSFNIVTPTPKYRLNYPLRTNGGTGILLKYDSNGRSQWGTYFGCPSESFGFSIALDNQNNIYITGLTINAVSSFDIYDVSMNTTTAGDFLLMNPTPKYTLSSPVSDTAGENGYLLKYNSNGISQWGTYFGANSLNDNGTCLAIDNQNNIYITGFTNIGELGDVSFNIYDMSMSPVGIDGSFAEVAPALKYRLSPPGSDTALENGYLLKYNSSGISQWGTYFGSNQVDYALDLAIDKNTNSIYITGVSDNSDMFDHSFNIYDVSFSSTEGIIVPELKNSFNFDKKINYILKYNSEGKSEQLCNIVVKGNGIMSNINIELGK